MRKRRWALFAFIIMLAFIFLSLESWRFFKANEKLKDYILAEFRPIVGEQLSISKVHVSFGNIHILGVRFAAPAKSISIDIRDLRIGYSFFNLLVRGFHPQYISQDALFIGPTITINPADSLLPADDLAGAAELTRQLSLPADFKNLDFFNHISIKDGDIVYIQDNEKIVPLAHSVQGGIYKQKGDSLLIDLDGAFFNSRERNIRLVGSGDFHKRIITNVQATLTNYALQHGLPLLSEDMIVLDRGELTGLVNVQWLERKGQYRVTGDLEIHDAAGDVFTGKLAISDMFSKLILHDNKIIIEESEQIVNNSRVTIAGELENVADPLLNITGESAHFDLGAFSAILGPQFTGQISGTAALQVSVRGPLDNIVIQQNIRASSLTIKNRQLQDFYADVRFAGKTVIVDSSRALLNGNEMSLAGAIDLSSAEKTIWGEIKGHGDVASLFAPGRIDSSISIFSNFQSLLYGSISRPVLDGQLSLQMHSPDADTLVLDVSFDYRDKKMIFSNDNSADGIAIHSTIDWNQKPPAIELQCRGGEKMLNLVRDIPAGKYFAEHMHSSFTVLGNVNNMELSADIMAVADGRIAGQLLHVDADIARKGASFRSDGVFTIRGDSKNAARGEFSLEKTATAFALKNLDIEDELTASLKIDLGETRELSGVLELNGFDINRLSKPDSSLAGKINSTMRLQGTLADPMFNGVIDVDDLSYRDVGPYESLIHFDYDHSQFNLEKFTLNFGKSTLLYAHGQYDGTCDAIDFSIKGAGFDAGQILGAAGKDSLISGAALIDLVISGTTVAPVLQGIVAIKEGRLWNIPFDELELRLAPTVATDSLRASPSAVIENFRLERFDVYEIRASGIYPFHKADSLILEVNGSGNFLQILNDVKPFFRSPQSTCSLTSRVRGTPMKPYLENAHLTIDEASMEFASVVAPVKNVRGELSFDADEQFLHLLALEGNMGEKPFRIYSDLAENVVSAKPLDNLHIGDSDFHFGVLILETPQKGVPLNFVGIMEPGEFGLLELVGRERGEKFYFCESPDGLTLRGRINLYDTEIMYPFYENTHVGSGKLKDFLRNLDWDLFVVPTKNTRFVRDFPGAIDQVYVDLKLDENFGGLEFTDQLVNDTFRINGHVRSTKGMIEYLNMNFRVEQAGVDFDRSSLVPVGYGSAKTTVTDSLGISSTILLTLQTVDNTMNKKSVDDIVRQEEGRARFDQIRFKLSSDNPNIGSSEAQILASLGYSTNNLQNNAVSAIGYSTDNLIFRPLFRPMEKELEQTFGLDYVRFSSQLTRNIIMFNLNNNLELNSRLALLESTKIIVGKYLSNNFFLQYTGQIESGVGYRYKAKHLGFHHTLGLEYQINPQVLVELEYDYDSLMLEKRDDKRIILRHWFPF
ncbi:translocation/assembly module TamB domain-containing protein [candidate division KSB1 bacterium]|nr:translocation/assembly module TamB domain-containing protein [candidate division KSB1 bacterium]